MNEQQTKWDEGFKAGRDYNPMNEILLDSVLAHVDNEKKTAVDLGCGTGDAVIKLAKRGMTVTGTDWSSRNALLAIGSSTAGALVPNILEPTTDSLTVSSYAPNNSEKSVSGTLTSSNLAFDAASSSHLLKLYLSRKKGGRTSTPKPFLSLKVTQLSRQRLMASTRKW